MLYGFFEPVVLQVKEEAGACSGNSIFCVPFASGPIPVSVVEEGVLEHIWWDIQKEPFHFKDKTSNRFLI